MNNVPSHLETALTRLSQKSIGAVQNGQSLDVLNAYLHIERPIERKLKTKMAEIDEVGGGIVLLIGSAGDGKSHLISVVKKDGKWPDTSYYNDATSSYSPQKTAVDTLVESLTDFSDAELDTTDNKLVLAINLGKLNSLIEDNRVKQQYSRIVESVKSIFDGDGEPKESERIKVLMFPNEQIFEFDADCEEEYPVNSHFISSLLEKITAPTDSNPIFTAYSKDNHTCVSAKHPVKINFELLSLPFIRNSITLLIIEAIIRFDLKITARELLEKKGFSEFFVAHAFICE